jgi:CrcB protein
VALVTALAVGIGGAAGAVSRYAVSLAIERRAIDTLLVNVAGSFALGFVLGVGLDGPARLALGVGFCGAFTTFSSFAVETVGFAEGGEWATAALNGLGTLLFALSAVVAGGIVGTALWR